MTSQPKRPEAADISSLDEVFPGLKKRIRDIFTITLDKPPVFSIGVALAHRDDRHSWRGAIPTAAGGVCWRPSVQISAPR